MQVFAQKKVQQKVYILCIYSIKAIFCIFGGSILWESYGHLMGILW